MKHTKRILSTVAILGVALPIMVAGYAQQSQESQAQEAAAEKPQKQQVLQVDVDLVVVTATVTDPQNRYVTGLEQDHFTVLEDKIEQKIEYFSAEDVPLTVGIVFDVSGSMKDKLSTARDAAVTFLKTGNPDDEYFLVSFANKPEVVEDFTTDISKLQSKLIWAPAKGMTALYDSVYVGLDKLKDGTNSKKALLLITDGEDNRSRYTFSNVKEFVKEQDVQIYSIGIVNDWNSQLGSGRTGRALIEELSDLTGGRSFFPDSVYELEDICTKIAIELKNQYVIGYKSTNEAKNGKWRKLQVKITPPKGLPHLNVRSKGGYYAPTGDGATAGNKK
jgi:Ca-activated chloride channel family protein